MAQDKTVQPAPDLTFDMNPSAGFKGWLEAMGSSLVFTTYQAGKVFMVGINRQTQRLSVFERSFPRSMGLGIEASSQTLWLASLFQIWRMQNFLQPGETKDGYDAVFVPLEGRTTGDVDVHDICTGAADHAGPVFVVSRFNCLATLDQNNSFQPIWAPPFIDALVAEDRCHLNGLAMRANEPAFVTCVSTSNSADGWRQYRGKGGVVIDVASREIVARDLSMPHSPRWHEGQLFILQSGTGAFGRIDLESGCFEPICELPGFARGLSFLGKYAVVGLSRPRSEAGFDGLALEESLHSKGIHAKTMIAVIDLEAGAIAHTLEIQGTAVRELYDVAMLPGIRRPMLVGLQGDDIRYMVRPGAPA